MPQSEGLFDWTARSAFTEPGCRPTAGLTLHEVNQLRRSLDLEPEIERQLATLLPTRSGGTGRRAVELVNWLAVGDPLVGRRSRFRHHDAFDDTS